MTPKTNSPVIVLTTDFGVVDAYVGVMKGVILGINPQAKILDLTHGIAPQDIRQAAFVLGVNHAYFPAQAIHVAVVDPGVGTSRLPLLVNTPLGPFLAPDNGLLTRVLWGPGDASPENDNPEQDGASLLPPGCSAYELNEPRYRLDQVSSTFHGRDIFAPAAAHLSLGVAPQDMGRPVSQIHRLAMPGPAGELPGRLRGEVIYADHFGNLVTNIEASRLPQDGRLTVEIKDRRVNGLSRTFHDPSAHSIDRLIALAGSHGHLEIAVRDGNAAMLLQTGPGETVSVTAP